MERQTTEEIEFVRGQEYHIAGREGSLTDMIYLRSFEGTKGKIFDFAKMQGDSFLVYWLYEGEAEQQISNTIEAQINREHIDIVTPDEVTSFKTYSDLMEELGK